MEPAPLLSIVRPQCSMLSVGKIEGFLRTPVVVVLRPGVLTAQLVAINVCLELGRIPSFVYSTIRNFCFFPSCFQTVVE
jgi:uncharacterized membrane protein YqaE (UPF0057 family)